MVYVAVLMWGTITSLIGAVITSFVTKTAGIKVIER